MSPGICCDDESNSYNSQICLLCVIYISFLPTLQAKLQQGLTNCQKKTQNCCYFHFDPFRNVIMRLIKKLTYLTLAFIVFFRVICTGNDLNILGFFISNRILPRRRQSLLLNIPLLLSNLNSCEKQFHVIQDPKKKHQTC